MSRRARSAGARGLRAACIVAGAAIGAAAMLSPVANAASGVPTPGHVDVLLHLDKLPPNVVVATHPLPRLGAHGPAFAPRSTATPDIIGGTTANSADFPGVVGIQTIFLADVNGTIETLISTCTGTVISPTKVLTAGHCDTDMPDGTTQVIAGRNDLTDTTSGTAVGVTSTWTNPNFNLGALNAGTANVPVDDVAVLTLATPLPSVYTPVTLTAQGDGTPYAAGTNATIVGYGITANGASDAGVLHQATVPIQSDTTCVNAMPGYDANRMTCAGFPTGGIDTCHGDSGGPLLVSGVEAGITDWGNDPCAAAGTFGVYERLSTYHSAIAADFTRPAPGNMDFTGDGHTDLLAVDGSGNLFDYVGSGFAGDGFGGFGGSLQIGSGWAGFSKLFRVTNWNGDGLESVMAETPDGTLFQYPGDGQGLLAGTRTQVGTGFNIFKNILVTNNWTGDGLVDLMGVEPNGDLLLYELNGHGGFTSDHGVLIGTGWSGFDTLLTPGQWTGDGNQTLIGRLPGGAIRLYESNEHGGFTTTNGVQIGTGFNIFSTMLTLGDWGGDDQLDMLGITGDGTLLLYNTDAHGNFLNNQGIVIGSGWNGLTVF